MLVVLRNPLREIEVAGPLTVDALLQRLELNPESVLVIAGDELVTRDTRLRDEDHVEIRPVISGGCADACMTRRPSEARELAQRGAAAAQVTCAAATSEKRQ